LLLHVLVGSLGSLGLWVLNKSLRCVLPLGVDLSGLSIFGVELLVADFSPFLLVIKEET